MLHSISRLSMRLFLLVVLCFLSSGAAAAQTRPVPPPDSLTVARPPASTDTVAAIHRFYVAKRRARTRVLLATGGLLLGAAAIGNIFGPERYGSYDGGFIRGLNLTFFAVPVVSAELLFYGLYSRRHERFSVEDFQAHQLPRSTRAQLKPKYFQEPSPPVPSAR